MTSHEPHTDAAYARARAAALAGRRIDLAGALLATQHAAAICAPQPEGSR